MSPWKNLEVHAIVVAAVEAAQTKAGREAAVTHLLDLEVVRGKVAQGQEAEVDLEQVKMAQWLDLGKVVQSQEAEVGQG